MRILTFDITGQNLVKTGDFSNIIRGTKGYLKCRFNFTGNDWNRCKAVAVFSRLKDEYPVPIGPDRTCIVPDELTDYPIFKLKVVGAKKDYRIATNTVLIEQEV